MNDKVPLECMQCAKMLCCTFVHRAPQPPRFLSCPPLPCEQEWDTTLSFSATTTSVSPCGKFLLVSTDGPRIMVFRVRGEFLKAGPSPVISTLRLHYTACPQAQLSSPLQSAPVRHWYMHFSDSDSMFREICATQRRAIMTAHLRHTATSTQTQCTCLRADFSKARILYGLQTASQFHQHVAVWYGSSTVIAAAEGGAAFVFSIASGKVRHANHRFAAVCAAHIANSLPALRLACIRKPS